VTLAARRMMGDMARRTSGAGGWILALGLAVGGFALVVAGIGASPWEAFTAMWNSTIVDDVGPGEVLVAATPILLCAVAVAIPARAGLWNLGGEGQLIFGVVGATAVSQMLPQTLGSGFALPLLGLGGAVAAGLWCAIPAALRVAVNLNEAISSLLMSYIALRVLDYLVNGPWKDPVSLGFPQAEPLPETQRLPLLESIPYVGGGRLHLGFVVALVAAALVVFLFFRTKFGFLLRVVGGNDEAARRSGLPVGRIIITAMIIGGLLAGLAGMVQLSGVEFQAKRGIAGAYGFLGFLVSWLTRHNPVWIVFASIGVGAVRVGGDALQIDANLPASSVNILLALLLLAVLARGRGRSAAPA
jgi:general nucleoside transport system permease protein